MGDWQGLRKWGEEEMESKLPKGLKSAEAVSLIKTRAEIGTGTEKDPVRMATQYWDFNGKLLFIIDDYSKASEP